MTNPDMPRSVTLREAGVDNLFSRLEIHLKRDKYCYNASSSVLLGYCRLERCEELSIIYWNLVYMEYKSTH